jgi:hypothetical protein
MGHKWMGVFLGVVVATSVAGGWRVAFPPVEPLLAPGAFAVHVVNTDLGRREVSYQVADTTIDWRAAVGRRLIEDGWTPLAPGVPETSQLSYHRATAFGIGNLAELVTLAGGPHEAHIIIIRRLYWKWLWSMGAAAQSDHAASVPSQQAAGAAGVARQSTHLYCDCTAACTQKQYHSAVA